MVLSCPSPYSQHKVLYTKQIAVLQGVRWAILHLHKLHCIVYESYDAAYNHGWKTNHNHAAVQMQCTENLTIFLNIVALVQDLGKWSVSRGTSYVTLCLEC